MRAIKHLIWAKLGNLCLKTGFMIKRDFNFPIINFPHLDNNIATAPAYGVYISYLIIYARTCSLYSDFLQHHRILSTKLLNQEFFKNRLNLSFKKFIGRYQHIVDTYFVNRIYTDDKRWYWQLYFVSKLIIVSLLRLTMAVYTTLIFK